MSQACLKARKKLLVYTLLVTIYFVISLKLFLINMSHIFHISASLLVVVPDSVSKSLDIEALHAVLVILFPVVLLLHLLVLHLLCVLERGLVIVHLVIHVVLSTDALHRVLLVKLIQQLHEHLVVVVESLCFNFLSPRVVVHLHVVKDSVH